MSKEEGASPVIESEVHALLQQYGCPVAYHQVRAQFLGAIASPETASPFTEVQRLWGGQLPPFASIDVANEFIGVLVMGLWNQLTGHSEPGSPMSLTKVERTASDTGLRLLARTRKEEIAAFLTGFYGGRASVQVPEDIEHALDVLAELGGMFEGILNMPREPDTKKSRAAIASILGQLDQLSEIAEIEMHRVAVSGAALRSGRPSPQPPDRTTH